MDVLRLRKRFPNTDLKTLRYHVMTEKQRIDYWVGESLKMVAVIMLLAVGLTFAIYTIASNYSQ